MLLLRLYRIIVYVPHIEGVLCNLHPFLTVFGDFDFRIKQKTLSYVNTGPFLRSVYCKDTFFVLYDALFMDLIFAKHLQTLFKHYLNTI